MFGDRNAPCLESCIFDTIIFSKAYHKDIVNLKSFPEKKKRPIWGKERTSVTQLDFPCSVPKLIPLVFMKGCHFPLGKIFKSKKSPTGPTERTPKTEYLVALATHLGVRW